MCCRILREGSKKNSAGLPGDRDFNPGPLGRMTLRLGTGVTWLGEHEAASRSAYRARAANSREPQPLRLSECCSFYLSFTSWNMVPRPCLCSFGGEQRHQTHRQRQEPSHIDPRSVLSGAVSRQWSFVHGCRSTRMYHLEARRGLCCND